MTKFFFFHIRNKYDIYNNTTIKTIVFLFIKDNLDLFSDNKAIEVSVYIKLIDSPKLKNKYRKEVKVLTTVINENDNDIWNFIKDLKVRLHYHKRSKFPWKIIDYIVFKYNVKK